VLFLECIRKPVSKPELRNKADTCHRPQASRPCTSLNSLITGKIKTNLLAEPFATSAGQTELPKYRVLKKSPGRGDSVEWGEGIVKQ